MNLQLTTRAATLEDVARLAGVSVATASRVLNDSERKVASDYQERVTLAAEELGYTTNSWAQATARGTVNLVSLVVADIADPYFGHIAAGVSRRATEVGVLVTVGVTGREPDSEVGLLRALRAQRPRAIILANSRSDAGISSSLQEEIEAALTEGCRVVAFGPGAGDLPTITIDNVEGGRALGAAVARMGHRHAVILGAGTGVRSSNDRIEGFRAGFSRADGTVLGVHHGDFSREWGAKAVVELLRAKGLPRGTLIFGVSDVIALGAMTSLRLAGRNVGNDIAVVGFGDIESARDVTPGLTTVRIPLERIGYRAMGVALGDSAHISRSERVEVVLRESTPQRA